VVLDCILEINKAYFPRSAKLLFENLDIFFLAFTISFNFFGD